MSFLHPSRWLALSSAALDPVLAPPRVPSSPGRHRSRLGGPGHEHHPARHRATHGGIPPGLVILYHQYHQPLFRLAALLTGDVGTAEMVVQDAFVALRRLRLPPDDPSALPYLCRLVVARSRQAPRFQPQATTAAAAAGGPREPLPGSPAMLAALRELPARQREAVVLSLYLDLTEEQVALAMRARAAVVRRYLTAARAALGAVLSPGGEPAAGAGGRAGTASAAGDRAAGAPGPPVPATHRGPRQWLATRIPRPGLPSGAGPAAAAAEDRGMVKRDRTARGERGRHERQPALTQPE